MKKVITWTPRILGILLALSIFHFGFVQFDWHAISWKEILTFLIALIPFYVVAIGAGLSWKRPWIGGILFLALAILLLSRYFFGAHPMQTTSYLIVGGILCLMGLLFLYESQVVISSWGGIRRAAPYAFTEQGVARLFPGTRCIRRTTAVWRVPSRRVVRRAHDALRLAGGRGLFLTLA